MKQNILCILIVLGVVSCKQPLQYTLISQLENQLMV